MRQLAIPTLALVLAAHASAQSFTSPTGHLSTPGNAYQFQFLGYYNTAPRQMHFVQIDNTLRGSARTGIHTMSYRRSPIIGSSSFPGRTTEIEIRMAHADWSRVVHYANQQIDGLRLTPWTTVFATKTVNLPDWHNQPPGVAPWDVNLLLDTHFDYNGTDALLWQMRSGPSNLNGSIFYPADRVLSTWSNWGQQSYNGTGCVALGRRSAMKEEAFLSVYGAGSPSRLTFSTVSGPWLANIWTIVGVSNPALELGLCEKLYASPDLILPKPQTSTRGSSSLTVRFPHSPSLVGVQLHAQSMATDSSQTPVPMALSRGTTVTYPSAPVFTTEVANDVVGTTSAAWPTTVSLKKGTGIITGFTTP